MNGIAQDGSGKMEEALITIGGVALTFAQSMTVRVALGSFQLELSANGMGDDETGKRLCANYKRIVGELNALIASSTQVVREP
jgi:hypothetical protein